MLQQLRQLMAGLRQRMGRWSTGGKERMSEATKRVEMAEGAAAKEPDARAIARDIARQIAEAVRPVADALARLDAGDEGPARSGGRAAARYAAEHMADLPVAYRRQLPAVEDPAELARAEQEIRAEYLADFEAAGNAVKEVRGDGGGAKVSEAVDTSKLTGYDLIGLGVQAGVATSAKGAVK